MCAYQKIIPKVVLFLVRLANKEDEIHDKSFRVIPIETQKLSTDNQDAMWYRLMMTQFS